MLRVFMYRAIVDEEIWRRGSERSTELSQAFETALLEHRQELNHPDPELAIDIAFRFIYNTLVRRVTHGESFESQRPLSDEDLIRELGEAAADYLLAPQKPKPARKRRQAPPLGARDRVGGVVALGGGTALDAGRDRHHVHGRHLDLGAVRVVRAVLDPPAHRLPVRHVVAVAA